jgi:hypothetical protein
MTPSPDTDAAFKAALRGACQHLNGNERVLYTKWKDGIDIEYPTLMIERFARTIWAARGEADARVWRCFHCDEIFTTTESAELHFGRSECDRPACQMSIEHVRWLEQQHHRGVQDDTEALRTIRSLAGEHEALRRRAEEEGYARGLADARKHPEDLGLVAAPPLSGG